MDTRLPWQRWPLDGLLVSALNTVMDDMNTSDAFALRLKTNVESANRTDFGRFIAKLLVRCKSN